MTKHTPTSAVNDNLIAQNIFNILGLAELPDDQKAVMLQKMIRIVYQRVLARIMDMLSDNDMRSLQGAIKAEDEQKMTAILAQHDLPSFAAMMAEEALFMKHEMDILARGDAAVS